MADPSVTERSFPFASGQGANVTQDDWSAMIGSMQDNGVIDSPGGTGLTVQPGPTQDTIQINPGTASINGFFYRLTAAKTLSVATNPGSTARTDLVVLALDTVGNDILPQVVTNATIASIAAGSIPLAEWTQKTTSTETASNWGSAVDKRWFIGARLRPAVVGVDPPAKIGGFLYYPSQGPTGQLKLGVPDGSGNPSWVNWTPNLGITGAVVGTTDTQTLTNKTLTSPAIASFVNAPHTHSDAASGGLTKSAPRVITGGGSLGCSTNYAAIPNLSFNVVAGATYRFQAAFQYQGFTAATSVLQPTMMGTCTASFISHRWTFEFNANGASTTQSQNGLGKPTTSFAGSAVAASATNYACIGDGIIVVNTSGTLQVGAGSKANSPDNCTVQSGGVFILEQLA